MAGKPFMLLRATNSRDSAILQRQPRKDYTADTLRSLLRGCLLLIGFLAHAGLVYGLQPSLPVQLLSQITLVYVFLYVLSRRLLYYADDFAYLCRLNRLFYDGFRISIAI